MAIGMGTILMTGNMGFSFASQIGTGTVVGSGTLTTSVNWNDTFSTPEASGSINGLVVTARVLPTLNMTISGSGTIALGNLSSASASTGSVNIEIGTNALNGASVTARSTNGGLANISSGSIIINSLTTDGFADSYRFVSVANTTDSTALGFSQSGSVNTEINNTKRSNVAKAGTKRLILLLIFLGVKNILLLWLIGLELNLLQGLGELQTGMS